MGLPVAPRPVEVHGPLHAVHPAVVDLVAALERPLLHPEPLAGELEHLRHERQRLQPAPLVERRQDLLRASHLDEVAGTQVEALRVGLHLEVFLLVVAVPPVSASEGRHRAVGWPSRALIWAIRW